MKVNTRLIVLHTTKYGESSVIVHSLSREYGRRSFFVRNASKKQMMTLFQPLNILEGDVNDDGKAKLMRENYCDGLGDCLPACPTNAISFEEREAPCKYLQLNFRRVQKDKAVLLRLKEADVQARCRLSLPRLL